jgi:hypothetical protein
MLREHGVEAALPEFLSRKTYLCAQHAQALVVIR